MRDAHLQGKGCAADLVPQAAIDAAVLAASKPVHDDGHTDCFYAGILLAAWPHLQGAQPANWCCEHGRDCPEAHPGPADQLRKEGT
jgi:hypothetical protein